MAAALAAAEAVVRTVLRHPDAYLFAEPVDPIALGIPTYFDVIKSPMDLGTILMRLTHRGYASAGEVLRDANLVWQNCLTFNPPGDPVTVACAAVRACFNDAWRAAALTCNPAPAVRAPEGAAAAAARPAKKPRKDAPPPAPLPPPAAAPPPPPPHLQQQQQQQQHAYGGDAQFAAVAASVAVPRCSVCAVQKKGKCGTPTAPRACLRRTADMAFIDPRRDAPGGEDGDGEWTERDVAGAAAARAKAAKEAARAADALRAAQEALHAAEAAQGAAEDAVAGMAAHDAPHAVPAPPGYGGPRPMLTPEAHRVGAFWWGLPRPATSARGAA